MDLQKVILQKDEIYYSNTESYKLYSVLFSNWYISLYIEGLKNFLLSWKQLYMPLLFLQHVLLSTLIDWPTFEGEQIGLL